MKKGLKHIFTLIIILTGLNSLAQQDPMFTQYMTNPVTINPAIAGTRNVNNLSLVYRHQWVGIAGAPRTASLAYSGPFKDTKVGLGANLIYDLIGPVRQTGLYLDYAYRLPLNKEKERILSLGLMGGFNYYQFNLLDLYSGEPDDDINADGKNNKFLPNFGLGVFYYTPKFFAGISVPKLLRNSFTEANSDLSVENKEEQHIFIMSGLIIDLTKDIKVKPSLIGRIVNGAPVSLDATATFMLYDKIWLGASYRFGDSWGGIIRWQINNNLHIGYSFDFTTSRLRGDNNGTHEFFLSYDFIPKDKKDLVRRFF